MKDSCVFRMEILWEVMFPGGKYHYLTKRCKTTPTKIFVSFELAVIRAKIWTCGGTLGVIVNIWNNYWDTDCDLTKQLTLLRLGDADEI